MACLAGLILLAGSLLQAEPVRAADDSGALEFLLQNARPMAPPRLLRQPPVQSRALYTPIEPYPARGEPGEAAGGAVAGTDPGRIGGGAICVRLCDGFYFPVPSGTMETRETVCKALCPDAQTDLYRGNMVVSAVNGSGRRYMDLATAFLYRKERVDACTCRADPGNVAKYLSPYEDPTLKAGDLVVTGTGAIMLTKGNSAPFKARDFVDFEKAGTLNTQSRRRIAELLGLSKEKLLARAQKPVLTVPAREESRTEDDIPEITVTGRSPDLPSEPVRNDARVVLPGPWVAP